MRSLLLTCLIAFAATASAAEYFVSTRGDDSAAGTSESAPLATIGKVASMLKAGDTLTVLPGEYREAMEIQSAFGTDICMVFDECPPHPCERDYAAKSLALTLKWAAMCKDVPTPGMKFGIVQGSSFADLRRESAEALVQVGFDGYAAGGVSVGVSEPEMMAALEFSEPWLPADKPRYAMGLGTPPQIVEMVARGVDMFDCVLPTRIARNGTAFTGRGTMNLKNAEFAEFRRQFVANYVPWKSEE